ncbi:MAG TPA: DUF4270 family protein [Crocinitomix sp.]|nr:DUF4270 family protein [Crocinitomix sp.]
MTKKNNLHNWRRVVKLSVSFLGIALIIGACKKETSTIGDSINPNGLNIITTDTFTVKTSSVELDSITTDETSISLLGALKDPEFGLTDCGIVTQIRLSSTSPNFGDVTNITVDSVVLSLRYSSLLHYGDLQNLTFEVYEIANTLNIDEDYYPGSPVTTVGTNLIKPGTETIFPDVFSDVVVGQDTLAPQLRLNIVTTLGDYFIANANEMTSNDNFTNFFRGLYVKVTDGSTLANGEGTVLYFSLEDALSKLMIYYTLSGTPKTYTFNINNKCARFSKITTDRTGTPVEIALNTPNAGQNKFYMQGTLIRPRIEFPHIMDLQKNSKAIINLAVLYIPVQDFDDPYSISEALFFGKINTKYITDYTKDYSSFFSKVGYDIDNKEFKVLLTQEIQAILDGERDNTGFRIYPPNFFGSTIERIIFNGPEATTKNKTRLEITYTTY